MNLIRKISLFGLSALLIVTSSSSVAVAAQTTDELDLIKEMCPVAQASLQRLESSDLVARTIRGSSYDSLLTLMTNFNTRLVSNGLEANEFISITNEVNKNYRQTFFNRYTVYATALQKVTRADCDQPQLFYNLLEDTRAKRNQVFQEVSEMASLISDYQAAATDLKDSLRAAETGEEE